MKLSDLLRDFVNERFILSLIIVNSFVIFLQCYPNAPFALVWVDACFTLAFVLEALVKIGLDGFARYWKDRWNRFDFIITLLSLPSLLQLFDMPEVLSTFSAVLALRLFRLLRLLKTLRILKSIPEVVSLLSGIKRALVVSHVIFS
ncbi:MAG: ion transporter, partial [Bacteroidaceae bacterium]|nr:ion transporter [Bacteroidaceae bacterium]